MDIRDSHPVGRVRNRVVWTTVWLALFTVSGCDNGTAEREAKLQNAQAQVRRIAEELDKQTTKTGSYVRIEDGDIKEEDPWGVQITTSYSQGGVAETLTVRSAGPDQKFHTDDDVVGSGMAMNLKGIGQGIKDNVGETAANAAKGVIHGTVDGIKEVLPFGKKKKEDDTQDGGEADADVTDETVERKAVKE